MATGPEPDGMDLGDDDDLGEPDERAQNSGANDYRLKEIKETHPPVFTGEFPGKKEDLTFKDEAIFSIEMSSIQRFTCTCRISS